MLLYTVNEALSAVKSYFWHILEYMRNEGPWARFAGARLSCVRSFLLVVKVIMASSSPGRLVPLVIYLSLQPFCTT